MAHSCVRRTLLPTGVMNLVCAPFYFFFFGSCLSWNWACRPQGDRNIRGGGGDVSICRHPLQPLHLHQPTNHLLLFACPHYSPHVSCFFCKLHCSCLKFGPDHLVSLIVRMCNLEVIYEQWPKRLPFLLLVLFYIFIIVFTSHVSVQQMARAQPACSALQESLSSSCTVRPPVNYTYFTLESKCML